MAGGERLGFCRVAGSLCLAVLLLCCFESVFAHSSLCKLRMVLSSSGRNLRAVRTTSHPSRGVRRAAMAEGAPMAGGGAHPPPGCEAKITSSVRSAVRAPAHGPDPAETSLLPQANHHCSSPRGRHGGADHAGRGRPAPVGPASDVHLFSRASVVAQRAYGPVKRCPST